MQLFGRPFKPRLWPTLIALPAFLVLLGLGAWQLERLSWKQGLIAELTSRMEAPPIAMPDAPADPASLEFRRVTLQGEFLHDKELYFPDKTYKGTHGLWVATPFRLDDGRVVIVNRGWVPDKYLLPKTRQPGLLPGHVTVEGILRLPGWKGWDSMKPANDPGRNAWYFFDLPAMAEAAGLTGVVPELYVEALGDESTGLLPIGLDRHVELPNDHLQYAITWFALALVLLGIYIAFHLRKPDRPDA